MGSEVHILRHLWYKPLAKSRGKPHEQAEEVLLPLIIKTTDLGGRAGPLLQPRPARGSVTRHARKGQPPPLDPSRHRQRRLYQAAKQSRHRRCHALYARIFRPDIRWRAWRAVRANGGSAGADGVRREAIERQGVDALLPALAHDLRAGPSSPQPGLRV